MSEKIEERGSILNLNTLTSSEIFAAKITNCSRKIITQQVYYFMNIKSEELEKYLQSSLSAIKKGVEGGGDFRIAEPIEFDLAIINTK